MKTSPLLTPALVLGIRQNKAKSFSSPLKASGAVGVNVSGTTRRHQTPSGCWLIPRTGEWWICCLVLRSQQCDNVGMWHKACAGRESRNTSSSTSLSLGEQESPCVRTVLCCVDGSEFEGRLGWISGALWPPGFLC